MKRRYRGPLIGATLGVAALIAVVTLGDLIQKAIGSNLSVLGGATIIKATILLEKGDYNEDPRDFNDQDMEMLRKIPGVETVAASVYSWWPKRLDFTASYLGNEYEHVRIMGIDPAFFNITAFLPMAQGREFTADDVKNVRNVCIIGNDIKKWFFKKDEAPLGRMILVGEIYCEIVGVLGRPDNYLLDETVLLPISTARTKIMGMGAVRRLSILPADIYTVGDVADRVMKALKAKRPTYPYQVTYDKERVAIIMTILHVFKLFVYTAVAATLILSGVGVANVMLATVRERTPEIGLRKAVGATNYEIAAQFLSESIIVSIISSVLGIVIGTTISLIVSLLVLHGGLELRMYGLVVLLAVSTCAVSGLLAGLAPARRAAALDPIVALRSE
ncbi:MAG: ABC transporter permease [Deltaproteobacteria bacterium]|nr:ABC transporter permease [Deltaproteobacteria bacterium]